MVNFLSIIISNPQIKYEEYFEIIRDFRKGGLNPTNYDEFIATVRILPPISKITPSDFDVFNKFNLSDISEEDFKSIRTELHKRVIEKSKKCWHPEAGPSTCSLEPNGIIKVSAAHSIQNNGVLSQIADNGHVTSLYDLELADFKGKTIGRNLASMFWGFCNKHDSVFRPIEVEKYVGSEIQNFLFAYRGFVVGSHKKIEVSNIMDFGQQTHNDIINNKKIFDEAILNQNYGVIKTYTIELPAFYSIAVSSSFYLDFDFEGNPIPHSDERMEYLFLSVFPDQNKTYVLISYFEQDENLYGNLGNQLAKRNNYVSDISILIAAHCENVYFNPTYYNAFIKKFVPYLSKLLFQTQFDFARVNDEGEIIDPISLTLPSYLDNPFEINFFWY